MLRSIEFFAGSGLVQTGLASDSKSLWANDNSEKKRDTFIANHGDATFHLGDIKLVKGRNIPAADLAWASFPCQDLSLAGNLTGMGEGTRSGLFWEWIRILWELREEGRLPPVLAAENVTGFIVADEGKHFKEAYGALKELGYRVGALTMNASAFLPQSRPRAFLIAVRDGIDLTGLIQGGWPTSDPPHLRVPHISLLRCGFAGCQPHLTARPPHRRPSHHYAKGQRPALYQPRAKP